MKDKPIPYAKDKDMNYENYIATCPHQHCKFQNIFNRVSDLKTVEPIVFKQVACLKPSCKKQFIINGDLVSENYEYLIKDCYDLLKIKRYMYCILNLCQACEMFFVRAIEVKLIYQPFKDKVFSDDCDQFNDLCKKLYTKIKDYTFENLKRIFFDLYFGFSDFYVDEFKLPLTIEKLCTVINENYTITLNAPNNSLGRLNELLMNPNFYDILKAKKPNMSISNKITALVDKTKDYRNRSFSDLNYDEKSNIKRLNRLLLEETYPQETPKSLYLNNKVFQSIESIEDYINTIDCPLCL